MPNPKNKPHGFPLIISGFTESSHLGDYYKRATQRLVQSLQRLQLEYKIYPMTAVGGWAQNCALKQTVILEALESLRRPILWVDADGEVFQRPCIFERARFDLALYSAKGHWLSGTLYVAPLDAAIAFIKQWKARTRPGAVDEITLLHAFRTLHPPIRLKMLPSSYNSLVHQESDLSQVVIGHYVRPDVAGSRGLKAVQLP